MWTYACSLKDEISAIMSTLFPPVPHEHRLGQPLQVIGRRYLRLLSCSLPRFPHIWSLSRNIVPNPTFLLVCLLSVSVVSSVCLQRDRCRSGQRHPRVHPRHRHVRGRFGYLAAVPQSGPEEAAWGHGPGQRRLRSRGTSGFDLWWQNITMSELSIHAHDFIYLII